MSEISKERFKFLKLISEIIYISESIYNTDDQIEIILYQFSISYEEKKFILQELVEIAAENRTYYKKYSHFSGSLDDLVNFVEITRIESKTGFFNLVDEKYETESGRQELINKIIDMKTTLALCNGSHGLRKSNITGELIIGTIISNLELKNQNGNVKLLRTILYKSKKDSGELLFRELFYIFVKIVYLELIAIFRNAYFELISQIIQITKVFDDNEKETFLSFFDIVSPIIDKSKIRVFYFFQEYRDFKISPKFRKRSDGFASTIFEFHITQRNNDYYVLRLDLPHLGAEFLHINIESAAGVPIYPLNKQEYDKAINIFDFEPNIFFDMGNNLFVVRDEVKKAEPETYEKVIRLFSNRQHMKITTKLTESELMSFAESISSFFVTGNRSSGSVSKRKEEKKKLVTATKYSENLFAVLIKTLKFGEETSEEGEKNFLELVCEIMDRENMTLKDLQMLEI